MSFTKGRPLDDWTKTILRYRDVRRSCRNISGHALMGRPAARLERMALVFSLYVLVCVVDKRWVLFLYGCNLLIYVMILYSLVPYINRLLGIKHYSTYDSTYECIIVGILPKYHISYNKYHSSTDTIVPAESSHWHHCCSGIFPYQLFKPYKHLSFDKI